MYKFSVMMHWIPPARVYPGMSSSNPNGTLLNYVTAPSTRPDSETQNHFKKENNKFFPFKYYTFCILYWVIFQLVTGSKGILDWIGFQR